MYLCMCIYIYIHIIYIYIYLSLSLSLSVRVSFLRPHNTALALGGPSVAGGFRALNISRAFSTPKSSDDTSIRGGMPLVVVASVAAKP